MPFDKEPSQLNGTSTGPAKVPNCVNWSSVKPPENVVKTAKAILPKPAGNGTVPLPAPVFVTCTKKVLVIWSTKATYRGAAGSTGTKKVDGSQVKVRTVPAAMGGWRFNGGVGAEKVSLGRRMMGRGCGHETTNICARL